MKNDKNKSKIILFFLILLFCLMGIMIFLLLKIGYSQDSQNEQGTVEISTIQDPKSVDEVIENYNSEYIMQEKKNIYVVFSRDLYNDDGSDNKKYFENIVNDLEPFFEESSFKIIDEENNIEIYARYDSEKEDYNIEINDIGDFYSKTDGDSYVKVETTEISKGTSFAITDDILTTLRLRSNKLSSITEYIGEGKDLGNGYTSYQNGTIKIRTVPTGGVKNIIFSKDYKENITYKLNLDMTLNEIAEAEKNYDFGSVDKGYLGYRHNEFYLFFYEDEVSAYTYSYKRNTVFEDYLKEYIETKDLDRFVKNLSIDWLAYDSFEYDEETQCAHILYSTRGVEIDIKDNNPKGITLYNNYYLTELTKKYVKNGYISLNPYEDLVEKTEIERRNND